MEYPLKDVMVVVLAPHGKGIPEQAPAKSYNGSFAFLALPDTGHETFLGILLEDPIIFVLAPQGKDIPK